LTLLRLDVGRTGAGRARLPGSLTRVDRLDPSRAVGQRDFLLQMGMHGPGSFLINGRSFAADRVDVRVRLGDLEVWQVRNVSSEFHPFHVHGAGFQVLSRSRGPLGPQDLGWKDTVLTWPGETVGLAIRFERHQGLYVLHCHNLEHEDAGMMLNLEVV
jgi:FtsP/CotA-like multicopper oxidase with cupredoxin domain